MHGQATLTWENYDGKSKVNPGRAIYLVNGEPVGQGREGVAAIIAALRQLPEGSELLVFPDRYVMKTLSAEGGNSGVVRGHDPVPFRRTPELYQEFHSVACDRNIDVWYLAGPPGVYVMDNGEDLRVKGMWWPAP